MGTVAVALLIASLANAQGYSYQLASSGDPSGGTYTGKQNGSYYTGSLGYGAAPQSSAGTPTCLATGTVTYTYTWSGPASTAPQGVIEKVTTSASWGGASGSCADGQEDTPSNGPLSGTFSGTHYYGAVGGATVTVTISGATGTGTTGTVGGVGVIGSASVWMTVSITPITLALSGVTVTGSTNNIAVGQYLTATAGSYDGNASDTYTWSTPSAGNPFLGYNPKAASCPAATPFAVPPTSSTKLNCFFGAPGSPNIACSYYSATTGATVPLTVPVTVAGPHIAVPYADQIGKMHLLTTSYVDWITGSPYPTWFKLWDTTYDGQTYGIFYGDVLTDPPFLTAGSGVFGHVQTLDRKKTYNGTLSEQTGLDTIFPQANEEVGGLDWTPCDGMSKNLFNDAPGLSPSDFANFTLVWQGNYYLYIFYKPTTLSDVTTASVYVPISYIPWEADGSCALVIPNSWTGSDGGSMFDKGSTTYPAISSWPTW